jgi:hypothetical protein
VSKQPIFKNAAVKVQKIEDASGPAPAPTTTASRPAVFSGAPNVAPTAAGADGEATETFRGESPSFPEEIRHPEERHP